MGILAIEVIMNGMEGVYHTVGFLRRFLRKGSCRRNLQSGASLSSKCRSGANITSGMTSNDEHIFFDMIIYLYSLPLGI